MRNILVYSFLAASLALLGVGCGLQQPQVPDQQNVEDRVEQLRKENEQLKRENTQREAEDDDTKDNEQIEEGKDEVQDQQEADQGREIIGELNTKADDNSVVVLLSTIDEEDHDDAYIAFGCNNQLVPVRRELEKEMSDLAHAIVELLTIKSAEYEEEGLHNSIAGLGLTLENIKFEDGKRVIDLAGQPSLSGVCEDARIQAQMEETIKLYSDNFEIRLNGSEENWEKLFDLRGE